MKLCSIEALGNDLYSTIGNCNCKQFPDNETLKDYRRYVRLSGYNDDNFFDKVNASPRSWTCSSCDAEFWYRWTRNGVMAVRVN